jgi:formylglycine-generating enzyme required for sulfatase activity
MMRSVRATMLRAAATAVLLAAAWPAVQALRAGPLEPAGPAGSAGSALGTAAACNAYAGLPAGWGRDPHAGMRHLSGGRLALGSDDGYAEERPVRQVEVGPFWIDRTEVTNAQFEAFVKATGYVTDAERGGSAAVFQVPAAGNDRDVAYGSWWHAVQGADWRHPEGPGSTLDGRANQPVVQVTRADALAYAAWLGRALPTEAQWEYAAKGGGTAERIERGPRDGQQRPTANFWQGIFPYMNSSEDGFPDRAPVGCFAANGDGLYDMIGNVWEWTADPWRGSHQAHGTGAPPSMRAAGTRTEGLIKGGSFLCSTDFCVRYRASARHAQETGLAAVHVGFRTVAPDRS